MHVPSPLSLQQIHKYSNSEYSEDQRDEWEREERGEQEVYESVGAKVEIDNDADIQILTQYHPFLSVLNWFGF